MATTSSVLLVHWERMAIEQVGMCSDRLKYQNPNKTPTPEYRTHGPSLLRRMCDGVLRHEHRPDFCQVFSRVSQRHVQRLGGWHEHLGLLGLSSRCLWLEISSHDKSLLGPLPHGNVSRLRQSRGRARLHKMSPGTLCCDDRQH